MKSKIAVLFILLVVGLVTADFASADLITCDDNCTIGDLLHTIRLIINTLLSWASLVSILFIVISGFKMIIARGNEEAISNAKTSLGYAIGGFLIIMLSFVILNFAIGILTGNSSDPINPFGIFESFQLLPRSP